MPSAGKQEALHIHVELLIEVFFVDLVKWSKRAGAGIGKNNVQLALLLFHLFIQLVDIRQFAQRFKRTLRDSELTWQLTWTGKGFYQS